MGLQWSQECADEAREREAKAMEELDLLVWDESATLSLDKVKEVAVRHRIKADRLKGAAKDREADQIRKSRFFGRNNVRDMEMFHSHKAHRYNMLDFYLGLVDIAHAM